MDTQPKITLKYRHEKNKKKCMNDMYERSRQQKVNDDPMLDHVFDSKRRHQKQEYKCLPLNLFRY